MFYQAFFCLSVSRTTQKVILLTTFDDFFGGVRCVTSKKRLCVSAVLAVGRCPSVCLSVCLSVCQAVRHVRALYPNNLPDEASPGNWLGLQSQAD